MIHTSTYISKFSSKVLLILFFALTAKVTLLAQKSLAEAQLDLYGCTEITLGRAVKNIDKILGLPGVYLDHGAKSNQVSLVLNYEGLQNVIKFTDDFVVNPIPKVNMKTKSWEELIQWKNGSNCMPPLDYYPTYEAYEQIMLDFEARYPSLCSLINIGTLNSGRKLWVLKISSQENEESSKPNFLYTSTMHGDEMVGYILMLNLIDYLLCNYDDDSRVKYLLDNLNIYINPLANPDGTYRGGNDNVSLASRFNSNFVDLNRNFPDPKGGPNPDGRATQMETQFFMDFANEIHFHMSCNLHGGIELVNYPWDTFSERHADNDWFYDISRNYADTVQIYSPDGYFTDFDNGITNGYDWVEIEGGRQDFHTYFMGGREVTLELSDIKRVDAATLPLYWDYNRNALLNYMEEATYGLRGLITDCNSHQALEAEIFIVDHDKMNSWVYSSAETGNYFRFLSSGTYDVEYRAASYDTVSLTVNIVDKSIKVLDIELCPNDMVATNNYLEQTLKFNVLKDKILFLSPHTLINSKYKLYNINGIKLQSGTIDDMSIRLPRQLSPGLYIVNLETSEGEHSFSFYYLK